MTAGEAVTLLVIAAGVWALIQFTGLRTWHAVAVPVARVLPRAVPGRPADPRIPRPHPRIVRPLTPTGKGREPAVTIRRHEFDYLCTEVDAGRLTEAEVIRWMHQDGWPGHSQIECWQWWDGEYTAWKARNQKQQNRKGTS